MANTETMETIAENLNAGGAHVGDLLWWALSEVEIKAAQFRALWTGAGLDERYLPEEPTAARALKDAGREITSANREAGYLFRLVDESKSLATFEIVKEERNAGGLGKNSYEHEATLGVDPHGGWFTDEPSHPVVASIRARYDALFGHFQAREVRSAILRLLHDKAAITLRDNGGVYWIPAPNAATARSLRDVIGKVGGSAVAILPVHASKEGNETLGAAVRGSLEGEIADLKVEIETFQAEGARPSTLTRRLAEFEEIRGRASLYREILAVEVADLDGKLDAMKEQVAAMLAAKVEK